MLTLAALKTQSHIEAVIFILSQCGWLPCIRLVNTELNSGTV